MKKIFFLFSISFLIILTAKAQKEDYVWRIGYDGGVDFNKGFADTFSVKKSTNLLWTNASICDSSGNLLFYTNGTKIYNRNSDLMLNGDKLNPTPYTIYWDASSGGLPIAGADIIIQRPNHHEQYYLFHQTLVNDVGPIYYCNVLYQTVVDMTLDSGRGGVTNIKNYHLYDNDTLLAGYLAAVRHANGRDWWLISKKLLDRVFYKWLITPDTIIGPYIQSNQIASASPFDHNRISLGQACISPNGDKYAVMYGSKNFYLYDFDRCTGNLNYLTSKNLNDGSAGTGCAFSQTGRYLYICTQLNIYQYDLLSGNILTSETLVATYDGFVCPVSADFNMMRLAPDGKIYLAMDNGCGPISPMHVIENPNLGGLACNVQQHSFSVPATNLMSVPNIPDYKLEALEGSPCDSLTGTSQIFLKENTINIYPNPLTSYSILQLNTQLKNAEVVIYDMLGKEMVRKRMDGDKMVLEKGSLESGIYFVRVSTEERQWVQKIVVE